MDNKYKWYFNNNDYLEFAENNVTEFKSSFNYKSYITPHSEMRELIGEIIEEFQYLESCINYLIECAIENDLYKGNIKFNFDNYNSATKIIKALNGVLIEDKIARKLLSLIRFRNYIIHSHYHEYRFDIDPVNVRHRIYATNMNSDGSVWERFSEIKKR